MLVGLSGISGATACFKVIKNAGIFDKYGLNVILLFDRKVVENIVSGDFSFGFVGAASIIEGRLRGDEIILIAGGANTKSGFLPVLGIVPRSRVSKSPVALR